MQKCISRCEKLYEIYEDCSVCVGFIVWRGAMPMVDALLVTLTARIRV